MTLTERRYGAQSMTAPLREVLMSPPGEAFGRAFDDPAHGFLRPVDLAAAQREHETFVDTLTRLGVTVHLLDASAGESDPDLVYVFDPLLVTDAGTIPLRPGKPNRSGEPAILEAWSTANGIPTAGRIEAPGTVEAGDTFWLRPGPVLHRSDPAHQRRWCPTARGAGGRRRTDLRRPVLDGSGRARPPHVGHLAGRG